MNYRELGRTGWKVSEISFGAWAIGGSWGNVDDAESLAALRKALDLGINLIDTSDRYGDGHSERLISQVLRERPGERVYVATKIGRYLRPHVAAGYNRKNLTSYVERCLANQGVESLDLVQLHCPPTEVYYRPEVFGILDDLAAAGKIHHYGVSVEKVEEALKAIEYPNVKTVQIIFNMLRHRPSELFFSQAQTRRVGILTRVPLASGLLTGKMKRDTAFEESDHRHFNRDGQSFDVGETFSGVPYEVGLEAVEELRAWVPEGATMGQMALRWILQFDAVSCAIPGAKRPEQVSANVAASDLPPLSEGAMAAVQDCYDRLIKPHVHHRW
jgi:aryl-alcohol dehydrogenase-like predicted oxidoreductase